MTSHWSREIFNGVRSKVKNIEVRNVHDIPHELRFLFENESGDLSLIPISEMVPDAESITFNNLSLRDMWRRGAEYTQSINEYSHLSRSRLLCRIEFRSECLLEMLEIAETRDIEQKTQQIEDSEWTLDAKCQDDHYFRIIAEHTMSEEIEYKSIDALSSKFFDLTLSAQLDTFNDYSKNKMDELAQVAVNTALRWCGNGESSFKVSNVDVHIDCVRILYVIITTDESKLEEMVDIIRGADSNAMFVEFDSMLIPIQSHREHIELSFAERVMAEEMDQKHDRLLCNDLKRFAKDAEKEWSSQRDAKVDEIRREILNKEQKEMKENKRKEIKRKAAEKRTEHELGLNVLADCKLVEQPLFRLTAEQLWQCIGCWIDHDIKYENALNAIRQFLNKFGISGATMCYVFMEEKVNDKVPVIERLLRNEMAKHFTIETMNIILESMRRWMITADAKALHAASTDAVARLIAEFPIKKLQEAIVHQKDFNGKDMIKDPDQFTKIVKDETGWMKADCDLLAQFLLRRISLESSQILDNVQRVATDHDSIIPSSMIIKLKDGLQDCYLEEVHFEMRTKGMMDQDFVDAVYNLNERLSKKFMAKKQNDEIKKQFEREYFDIVSSALLMTHHLDSNVNKRSAQSSWICVYCGHLNAPNVVHYRMTVNAVGCSLCGIMQKEAIIMVLRQIHVPFQNIVLSSDSIHLEEHCSSDEYADRQKHVTDASNHKDNEFGVEMNYTRLIPKYGSIRGEVDVDGVISDDDFFKVLNEAIAIYRKWTDSHPTSRRSHAFSVRHGILRNESISIKHIVAYLLYANHNEFALRFRESFYKKDGTMTDEETRNRHEFYYHFGRALLEAIYHFGYVLQPNEQLLHGLKAINEFSPFGGSFNVPICTTKRQSVGMYIYSLCNARFLCLSETDRFRIISFFD